MEHITGKMDLANKQIIVLYFMAVFFAAATWFIMPSPAAAADSGCDYLNEVRSNPSTQRSFMAHFNFAKNLPLMLYGDLKRQNDHLFAPYTIRGKTFTLDKQTIGCLGCHNEMLAIEVKNGVEVLDKNFHSTLGKHAIGLNYHDLVMQYPLVFAKPDLKQNNIIFIGGKLGCLSCHNPFSTLQYHLNAPLTNDGLCKGCHRR